ncbi:MAG: hypothetical protein QM504_06335, partial [Pseudomonadota bacterium]
MNALAIAPLSSTGRPGQQLLGRINSYILIISNVVTSSSCLFVNLPNSSASHGNNEVWMLSQVCANLLRNLLIHWSF